MTRSRFAMVAAFLAWAGLAHAADRLLIFSKTLGFRHDDGIVAGIAAIKSLGVAQGFVVDASENSTAFTDANLAQYKAVVFLSPSGEILDADQKAAFKKFIRNGNGFVGLHNSTAFVLEGWGWYDSLICARYDSEIHSPSFRLQVVDKSHISTVGLPATWNFADEDAYNFKSNPKALGATVLINLDETGLDEGAMGKDHPYSWYHRYDGGRAWYTIGGSSAGGYSDSLFLKHLAGGIKYAMGNGDAGIRGAVSGSGEAPTMAFERQPAWRGGDGKTYSVVGRRAVD